MTNNENQYTIYIRSTKESIPVSKEEFDAYYPVLGEKARNNGHVVYSLDFDVTPHQLRHTYITNLIYASVDPKTVQGNDGHLRKS